jgi:hypothetical protein
MEGVINDCPAIIKVVETFIKEYELDDRMEVMGPDRRGLRSDLGEKHAQLCQRGMDSLIAKIYDSLSPGGNYD